jgi:hypothetical protein
MKLNTLVLAFFAVSATGFSAVAESKYISCRDQPNSIFYSVDFQVDTETGKISAAKSSDGGYGSKALACSDTVTSADLISEANCAIEFVDAYGIKNSVTARIAYSDDISKAKVLRNFYYEKTDKAASNAYVPTDKINDQLNACTRIE